MVKELPFQKLQKQVTAYLRDPKHNTPPENANMDRLGIYEELLFNNQLETIQNSFPVCTEILSEKQLLTLVRDFFKSGSSNSPYFTDIPKAFVEYLTSLEKSDAYPIFLTELAHYEYLELALEVMDAEIDPSINTDGDLLNEIPVISPFAWLLQYQFPVNKIGADYQPTSTPEQPTFLIMVRNDEFFIDFIQINLLTAHLMNIFLQDPAVSGKEALLQLAEATQAEDKEAFLKEGFKNLQKLQQQSIIIGTRGTS